MLIHCTMEELIAVRDGQSSAAAVRHVEECEACRDELERLHQRVAWLKALPSFNPPRDRWAPVREAVVAERRAARRSRIVRVSLAAAASLALLVGIGDLVVPGEQGEAAAVVASLAEESQRLESVLRDLHPASRVMNGRMAGVVVGIEDLLADCDARLAGAREQQAPAAEMVDLWRERIGLVDALVTVHATRATHVEF